MAQTLSNFDNVLKDFYEGYVRRVLNDEVKLLKILQKDTSSWSGRQVVFPVNSARNWGVGFRGDGATLPAAQFQRYLKSTITAKNFYGHVEVTGPTMVSSRDDRGSFARALSSEVENMMNDLKNYMNIILFGDGLGTLATVTSATSTYQVQTTVSVASTRHLRANQVIDVIASAAVLVTFTIVSVDSATQITYGSLTGTGSRSATDTLVNSGDYNVVPMGLKGIIDDGAVVGTLQNILRSGVNNQVWKANVLSNGGAGNRALSLDLLQRGFDIALEYGGGYIDYILGHLGVRREYINLLTPDVRFSPLELKGGYKTLEFNGVPFDFDRHCDYNRIYMLNRPSLRVYLMQDFKWADEDGSILRAAAIGSSAKDSFEAFTRWIGNIGTDAPNRMSVITEVTQTTETPVLAT